MLKITHADVTRQDVWDAFRRCHDVRLRERYHAVLLLLDGHTCPDIATGLYRDEDTIRIWNMRSMSRDLRGCNASPFPVGPRDCTRPIARPSRRWCVKIHAR
jgi:hypothetical protein